MGTVYLEVAKSKAGTGHIEPDRAQVLPEVLPETLAELFSSLSASAIARMLRDRLVPLGNGLYADAAPWMRRSRYGPTRHIVAQVSPHHFHRAIFHHFGSRMMREAVSGLRRQAPIFSAKPRLTRPQFLILILSIEALVALFMLAPLEFALHGLCEIFSLIFLSVLWIRVLALSSRQRKARTVPAIPDAALPVYTVLVPLYREEGMLGQMVRALCELDYPHGKLDIKLLLEESDLPTRDAVARAHLPPFIEVLVAPDGEPRTKPRALNYGMHFARGSLVTIFDAEDVPDPQQLRRAAETFAILPESVACLQAELAFHNADENWLSRQFAVEYAVQFRLILPALARHHLPLPLGGTSNHFRSFVLRDIGGWDPFNVTEDADIGMRLARLGYRTATLPSITYEEANIEFRNWLAQRARWLKGFLQTWFVHMRHPGRLLRELGPAGFLAVQSTLFGVMLSALLHPIFLAIMIWQIAQGTFLNPALPSPWLEFNYFYVGTLALSYGLMMACGAVASRGLRLSARVWIIASMPGYWLLSSPAGWIALWQFIRAPFHWNKTRHGLSRMAPITMKRVPLVRGRRILN